MSKNNTGSNTLSWIAAGALVVWFIWMLGKDWLAEQHREGILTDNFCENIGLNETRNMQTYGIACINETTHQLYLWDYDEALKQAEEAA